jgi:hypothetical protein
MDFGVIRVLAFGALMFGFVVGLALAGDCLDLRLVVDDAGAMPVATHLVVHRRGGAVRIAMQLTLTAPPIVLASFTILPAVVTGRVVVVQAEAHIISTVVVGVARAVAVASVFVDTATIKGGPGFVADALGQRTVLGRDGSGRVEIANTVSTARRRQLHAPWTDRRTDVANVVRIAAAFQTSFVADLTTAVA